MPYSSETIRSRIIAPSDAGILAQWMARDTPIPADIRSGFASILARLLRREQMRGCTFERRLADGSWQPLGFGLSSFTDDLLIDTYLGRPNPNVFIDLLMTSRAHPQRPGFLNSRETGIANAGSGVNLAVHYYSTLTDDLDDPTIALVTNKAMQHFVEVHRGYNLKSLYWVGRETVRDFLALAGMEQLQTIAPGTTCPHTGTIWPETHYICGFSNAAAARRRIGSSLAMLFHQAKPQIGYSVSECRTLVLATDGMSDQEICDFLEISINTLKHTWRSIFRRTEALAPFALGDTSANNSSAGVRGPEKRRNLIKFLRDHPAELRPFILSTE